MRKEGWCKIIDIVLPQKKHNYVWMKKCDILFDFRQDCLVML